MRRVPPEESTRRYAIDIYSPLLPTEIRSTSKTFSFLLTYIRINPPFRNRICEVSILLHSTNIRKTIRAFFIALQFLIKIKKNPAFFITKNQK